MSKDEQILKAYHKVSNNNKRFDYKGVNYKITAYNITGQNLVRIDIKDLDGCEEKIKPVQGNIRASGRTTEQILEDEEIRRIVDKW